MVKYVFKDNILPIKNAATADAQAIGEALESTMSDAGGDLRTEAALEAARDPKHPCHQHLEWDDRVAGHKYRLDQMRAIIRCLRIVDAETDKPVHAFLSVSDRGGVSYRTIEDVKTSADLRLIVLKRAERDLQAWEDRYREISDACKLVASARSKVRKRRERIEARAT